MIEAVPMPPRVSAEQQVTIRNFELEGQVLSLQLQALERRAQDYMQGLRVEGYQLQRDQIGQWRYVAVPAPEEGSEP